MRTTVAAGMTIAWCAVVWLAGWGLADITAQETAPVAPSGVSSELGPTGPFGPLVASDDPPAPTPTKIRPENISALENQLHDTMQQYLTQRGWTHNCDAPGGCWLWQKTVNGQSYRLNTDDALNVEYVVQHEEEEEILRLHVSP